MAISNVMHHGFLPLPVSETDAKRITQTEEPHRGLVEGKLTELVNMDEFFIKGDRKESGMLLTDARQRARFNKLFDMSKSFLPLLEKTGMEKGLK